MKSNRGNSKDENTMYAVDELKKAGFDVWLDAGKIRYKQVTEGPVDEEWINNLLQNIKEYKQEAISYIQAQDPTSKQDPINQGEPAPPDQGHGWTPAMCPNCRAYIVWPNYPLGGGTRHFCGYWEGSKKVELCKLKECPNGGAVIPRGKERSL
jgi:hypothetical protein